MEYKAAYDSLDPMSYRSKSFLRQSLLQKIISVETVKQLSMESDEVKYYTPCWDKPEIGKWDVKTIKPGYEKWQPWGEVKDTVGNVYQMKTPSTGETVEAWVPDETVTEESSRYWCHGWGLQTYDPIAKWGYSVTTNTVAAVLDDKELFECVVPPYDRNKLNDVWGMPIKDFKPGAQYTTLLKLEDLYTKDPWTPIEGDVVAFWSTIGSPSNGNRAPAPTSPRQNTKKQLLLVHHTARIEKKGEQTTKAASLLTGNHVRLSSKNGAADLQRDVSYEDVLKEYPSTILISVHRAKLPPKH